MSSKQAVTSNSLVPGHGGPGGGQTLKSERIQLHVQLPERARRQMHDACGGRMTVGEEVVVSFELTPVPICHKGGNGIVADLVEAGPAVGTPGHSDQRSTFGKEADHAGI